MIYLDHNATTPVHPRVFEAVRECLQERWGNPSSNHPVGWDAKEKVEEAREKLAALVDCEPAEITFTSGGTESTNLALFGVAAKAKRPGRVVISAVEHPATTAPCEVLQARGWEIRRIPVGEDCVVSEGVAERLMDGATLVSLMHSNNEVGAIQPVAEVAEHAHRAGAVFHVDAAQSVGKVPVSFKELGADLMTVAGHKLYAPKGIGALVVRNGLELRPFIRGAGQERGLRPGTENVAGMAALGAAAELALEDLETEGKRQATLRNELERLLKESIAGLVINSAAVERLPNTSNLLFPGVSATALLARCDNLAASTGAACHDDVEEPSAVLTAMGIEREPALGAVRLSLGRETTADHVQSAARELISVWQGMIRTGA